MRKLALFVASALLIASNAYAGNETPIDLQQALAKSLLNPPKSAPYSAENGSFTIVYGGQDISRKSSQFERPVLVG